jgi:hypothetical protein
MELIMKNILIIIVLLLITIALVKGYECFVYALRVIGARRWKTNRPRKWNSFTGYQSEKDMIEETLDRR